MGAVSGKDSKTKTFILALLGIFSIAVAGDCGNGTGTDSGFGAGGQNVEITGVISSSVEAPDGLAQTTGGDVTCTEENFLCELMVSDPDGSILASEQVIVSLQTCGGRPVSGQTYSLGSVQVDPDSVPQGFNISSNCLPVDANLIDEFFNGFEGEVDVALGPDGLASVVITHRNSLDFLTSQEAIDLASLIGCPTLLGIQLLLAVSCNEGNTGTPPPATGPPPPKPPAPPPRTLAVKNQAEPPPSEESFFCDILPTIIQGALESSFCLDCEVDCAADDTCEFEGYNCNTTSGCCTCPSQCKIGSCPPDLHCAAEGNCCICDNPCSKGPCPEGTTCNKSNNCCVAASCGNSIVESGEQCDPPTKDGSKQCLGGGCSATCQCESGATCGNGKFDGKEVCDPPGKQSGKCDVGNAYCGFDCMSCDHCGDGTVQKTEVCDPPGSSSGLCGSPSTCSADCHDCETACTPCGGKNPPCGSGEVCTPSGPELCCQPGSPPFCGNSIVEPPEVCDTHAASGPPICKTGCLQGCSACHDPNCGNGTIDLGEDCDSDGKTILGCEAGVSECIPSGNGGECRCSCNVKCSNSGCPKGQMCDLVTQCCSAP